MLNLRYARPFLKSIHHISLLSVDAEGHDALVIEGARNLFIKRRVDIVEFEYIARGFWRQVRAHLASLRT